MSSQPSAEAVSDDRAREAFHERALSRMMRTMQVASVLLVFPIFWFYRWPGVIGVAIGSAVSYINFRMLARGVESLADRIVNRGSPEKGRKIVLRFLVRYALVAVVAYAIFRGPAFAFRGFLWGLCLPVVALMVEAGVEAYVAFRE